MNIDFPEVFLNNLTYCLGIVINQNKINEIVYIFNKITTIKIEKDIWDLKKMFPFN